MSETTEHNSSNSQSQLIEVHHVGVTAKLQSPLKKLLPRLSSSMESDMFQHTQFQNEAQGNTTETTELSSPHVLYEMHTEPAEKQLPAGKLKPQRIEFQRYCKSRRYCAVPPRKRKIKAEKLQRQMRQRVGFFARLCRSLDNMCKCQPQHQPQLIDDLPEPHWNRKAAARDTCIGVYPFEHGSADYLSTTDTHPKINSIVLADRATTYATHFWAEFFGVLHIAVAFVVAFVLQCYRFVLYSLVNTLIVGLLHMTSDYMVKPLLTVLFNGFLQPPMIFVYNVLCSVRDILEPVADTLNNFMKPMATVGSSIRLINVNYRNVRRLAKDV